MHRFAKVYDNSIRDFVKETLPRLPAWRIYPRYQAIKWKDREGNRFSDALDCCRREAHAFPLEIREAKVE